MGEVVGDEKNKRKIDFQKVKYGIEASCCLLFKYAWFKNCSAQWREHMFKTQNVIFGCSRGLGKK